MAFTDLGSQVSLNPVATAINLRSSADDYVNNLTGGYLLKGKSATGINGFVFDFEGEESATLSAEISDHYAENNTPLQDHMAIKPLRITLRGFVGELVNYNSGGVVGLLNTIQNKLTTVNAYLGRYTPGMIQKIQGAVTQAQSVVSQVDTAIGRANNLLQQLPGMNPGITKQHQAFNKFKAMMNSKQVFTVVTPYGAFNNMVLEMVTFIQPEESTTWSDISVTVKQVRFAEVISSTSSNMGGRSPLQAAAPTDSGRPVGVPADSSMMYKAQNWIRNFFTNGVSH